MSDVVIKIQNLSKQYRLGLVGTGTLSHDLNRWWHRVRGNEDPYLKIGDTNDRTVIGNSQYTWALRDINLEVKKSEVLGIIGKNGAGKSTLLKILSRVTGPTTGSVKVKGRIGSLLEVGTGFHPELTGKENIFLNGAILGMTKWEIKSKLEEIIEFSGTIRYIDTPVKRYSSGMKVRLAFAVAAHLDPDILVVDEVLAVGDAEFQKKAIGKMQEISKGGGRTVLFVSHNMGTINALCEKCILLKEGKVDLIDKTKIVTQAYNFIASTEVLLAKNNSRNEIFIKKIETVNSKNENTSIFAHSEDINLRITIGINYFQSFQNIGLALLTVDKNRVFTVNKSLKDFCNENDKEITVDFIIKGSLIAPMNYSFLVALNTRSGNMLYEILEDICPIKVFDDGTDFAFAEGSNYGSIIYKDKWALVNKG